MKIVSFNINSIRARLHQIEHLRDSINPVADKTTPVLIIKGWPNGIKDNIAPIKAVLFFISKILLINIPTVEIIDFIRFLWRDSGKVLPKTDKLKL